MKLLRKLPLWQQIAIVCCLFTLPVATGTYFTLAGLSKDIDVARLEQAGNRYQRPFADLWEFVRFAEEQKLGLDLTSPPQRPE